MKSKILRDVVIFLAIISLASDCNKGATEPERIEDINTEFTVEPNPGLVNTTFTFDASNSYYTDDDGYKIYDVTNRWDFDYTGPEDLFWDTEPLIEDIATHIYTEAKTYRVLLTIMDLMNNRNDTTSKLVVVTEATNTPPHPLFTIYPEVGYVHYIYDFNALLTWDNEDLQESLQLRWDYETDYIFDLDWGDWDTTAITFHIYDTPGEYTATLHAKDSGGLVDSITAIVNVLDYLYDVPCPDFETVFHEGKEYNTVLIVDQCWLKESLNFGVMLEYGANSSNNGQVEKFCYHNLESMCDQYGAMYQWDEMMNYVTTEGAQGICPPDWHIPSFWDIDDLKHNLNRIGEYHIPGINSSNNGKQIQHPDNICEGNCEDLGQSGFDFLLGGGSPDPLGNTGGYVSGFYSSTEHDPEHARSVWVSYDDHFWDAGIPGQYKLAPYYVRCIKDEFEWLK